MYLMALNDKLIISDGLISVIYIVSVYLNYCFFEEYKRNFV